MEQHADEALWLRALPVRKGLIERASARQPKSICIKERSDSANKRDPYLLAFRITLST
jgi:carboxylesterase type B